MCFTFSGLDKIMVVFSEFGHEEKSRKPAGPPSLALQSKPSALSEVTHDNVVAIGARNLTPALPLAPSSSSSWTWTEE